MTSSSHNLRFPVPLWEEAQAEMKRRGGSVNGYLTACLRDLLTETHWRERALAAEAELKRIKGEQ